jgi:hypothetical protein
VELIKKVIDNKDKNRISNYDYVSYEQYEKMEVLLTKLLKIVEKQVFEEFQVVFENNDSTKIEGKACCRFFLNETVSQKYYRRNPEKTKTYILGEKKVNFGDYLDVEGLNSYFDRMYEDVDVYQNNILCLAINS